MSVFFLCDPLVALFNRLKAMSFLCPTTQNLRKTLIEMVGVTGFEIAFCLFLDFGLVRYLAE